jgi:F-type H+-transporting ATPase subunit gamma
VGQFNDSLAHFVAQSLLPLNGTLEIWAVGERIQLLLSDIGFNTSKLLAVPGSVNAITPFVQQILAHSEAFLMTTKPLRFMFFIINQNRQQIIYPQLNAYCH